ncbi:MAG: hypothetical protein AB8E82_00205 [Aureispira sp.]
MISLQEYFKEHQHSFWHWRDQTEVIALNDGSTLVYKAYLITTLEGLALADTPPLDCVLLALAATKPQSQQLLAKIQQDLLQLLYGGVADNLEVPEGFRFLDILQQLPVQYHQDKERLFLLQTLFTNAYKAFEKENMQKILAEYKQLTNTTFEQLVTDDGTPINVKKIFHSLHILKVLAQRFKTVEDLLNALKEAQEVEAPLLEESTQEVEPHWRENLLEDFQTFYMATLFAALQAGLALPSLQRLQQQEAFGGTADLSNKGELDRLLISEFAYDQTLFLSRLVNREALYRQREATPERPALTRHILIDTSIYNWGSIKQVAFGIALALEKVDEKHLNSLIYTLGKELVLLPWNSVESIKKALNRVYPQLHAAESLQTFFKTQSIKQHHEVVLISSKESMQQLAMQQVMRHHQQQLHYYIQPTAQGKISVYQYALGKKLLQEFQLTLQDAWDPSKLPVASSNAPDLNTQALQTPILVPEPKQYEQLLWADTKDQTTAIFMLAPHGHLLRYIQYRNNKTKGWQWSYSGLVDYTLAEVGQLSSGDFVLLVGMRSPSRLDLVNISRQTLVSIELPQRKKWYLNQLVFDASNDVFYAFDNAEESWVIELPENPVLRPFEDRQLVLDLIQKHKLFVLHEKNKKKYTKHYQLLKNINAISVTEQGHLLINGRHQLQLAHNNIIKISTRTSPTMISAQQDYKKRRLRQFTFPDGSTVTANSLGLMTLTSSNQKLPKIYLPTTLNKSLGMATEEHFCGNPYYCNDSIHQGKNILAPDFFFTFYLQPFIDTILGNVVT